MKSKKLIAAAAAAARRGLCSQPLIVDRSFTSRHVAADGRVFQYATVIVKCMRQGESALPAWEHACSLVGTNPPTLAVAFLSKPTDSALAALADFSLQFSHTEVAAYASGHDPQHSAGSTHSKPIDRMPELHSHSSKASNGIRPTRSASRLSSKPLQNFHRNVADIGSKNTPLVPLIGCVASDHHMMTLTTSIISSTINDIVDDLIWMDDSDVRGDDPSSRSVGDDGGQGRDKSTGCSSGMEDSKRADSPEAAYVRLKFDNVTQVEKNTEEEATFSDWEELIRECDHLKIESAGSNDAKGDGGVSEVEVDFILQEGYGRKVDAKEILVNFWNHFVRSDPDLRSHKLAKKDVNAVNHSRAFIESVFMQHQLQGRHVNFQKTEFTPRGASQIGGTVAQGDQPFPEKAGCQTAFIGREVFSSQLDYLLETPRQGYVTTRLPHQVVDNAISEEDRRTHDRGRDPRKDDETYRLILCVGNMPGVKATGFYTRTTGLPWLPDLPDAVTTNNPHMLLLGAPGFNMSELIQRLVQMFPKGCRAGMVADNHKDQGSTADKASQIFYGEKPALVGAVGLSISSSEGAGPVPVDAFSEFARMSIGMLPGSCQGTFLDETLCRSLFSPQNGKVEWLDTIEKAYKVDPKSVLDKMYTKLHNKCEFPSYTASTHMAKQEALEIDSSASRQSIKPVELEKLSIISVNKVLFPGFFIPLSIDNPCDRLMVKNCIDHGLSFGVSSLCTEHSLGAIDCNDIVGTIGNIKVSLFHRDYRSYIIAHGVRRFRVINRRFGIQPGAFGQLVGQVELIDDMECAHEKDEVMELARRALGLCQQLFPSAAAMLGPGRTFQDPIIASFAVSHILPVSVEVKRRWLSMVDTKYRLKEQISFLNI